MKSNGHKRTPQPQECELSIAVDTDNGLVVMMIGADGSVCVMVPEMARLLADMLIGAAYDLDKNA